MFSNTRYNITEVNTSSCFHMSTDYIFIHIICKYFIWSTPLRQSIAYCLLLFRIVVEPSFSIKKAWLLIVYFKSKIILVKYTLYGIFVQHFFVLVLHRFCFYSNLNNTFSQNNLFELSKNLLFVDTHLLRQMNY